MPPHSLALVQIERVRPPYGTYKPVGRSALVSRVVSVPVPIRRLLGVNDFLVASVDSIVTMCALVLEESDAPLLERLSQAGSEFAVLKETPEWIADALQHVSDTALSDWVHRLKRADHLKVLNRLLGTAAFDAIRGDFQEDARTVLMAVRVGVNFLRPWALAMDDALGILTEEQRKEVGMPVAFESSLFGMALNADEWIGTSLSSEIGFRFPKNPEHHVLEPAEVAAAMDQFRAVLRARADSDLAELSEVFSRKVRGARDALELSVDGVSQAANSLVELIDRIAREAFSEAKVLEWLAANGLRDSRHTYGAEGRCRPTKRGQLLCLAWAGAPMKEAEPGTLNVQKVAAYALLNIRESLQKLKHADEGTESERVLLRRLLDAIEATTVLMVKAAWAMCGREHVQALRAQFAQ